MRLGDSSDWADALRRGAPGAIGVAEYAAAALLALLTARLVWAAIGPVGLVGTPPPPAVEHAADAAIFARFDPYFQTGASGPVVVSDLNIDLFGTRVDNVSGRGSAIIAASGEPQRSFIVGEEIVPGVVLHSVAFDSVTVSRGGTLEQLFLDQSVPAREIVAEPAAVAPPAKLAPTAVTAERITAELSGQPVVEKGRITGIRVADTADDQLLNQLGLMAGDILLSVNGTRIDSAERAGDIGGLVGTGATIVIEVKRGAEVKTIRHEMAR